MVDLNFSLEGGEVVSRRLMIAADGVKTYREPLTQIGRNLMKTWDMNFSSRGGLFGGWAPRKPQYRGGSRIDTWPLLEKSGRMRNSFRQRVTDTSIELDNTARYFVYHQSTAPRSKLPRRVMMKLRQQEATFIVKAFQSYLISVLRGRGER